MLPIVMQVVNGVAYFFNINNNFKILRSIILIYFFSQPQWIYWQTLPHWTSRRDFGREGRMIIKKLDDQGNCCDVVSSSNDNIYTSGVSTTWLHNMSCKRKIPPTTPPHKKHAKLIGEKTTKASTLQKELQTIESMNRLDDFP